MRSRFFSSVLASPTLRAIAIAAAMVLASALLGFSSTSRVLLLLVVVALGSVLWLKPVWGLLGIVIAALAVRAEISTGTAVRLNATAMLVPILGVIWLLRGMIRRDLSIVRSSVTRPLFLFLVSNLFSLLLGIALWDPAVPRSGGFALVQLAQWGIFGLSALAFWLSANTVPNEFWIKRLTWAFLLVGGILGALRIVPFSRVFSMRLATITLSRAPFWMLLSALAGGQIVSNTALPTHQKVFLYLVTIASLYFVFVENRNSSSGWVGVGVVISVIMWLRYPRLRWPAAISVVGMTAAGILFPAVYEFAGGEADWIRTGGSRIALIRRVLQVTNRNPVFGLGPAAYRVYAAMEPLRYGHALWRNPMVSSHNNYVDFYAHGGIVGLGLFLWTMAEIARTGLSLLARSLSPFSKGFVVSMLAALASATVLMAFADWILPFVYNIGFPGFQASALVWLFWGCLVALDAQTIDSPPGGDTASAVSPESAALEW